MSLYKNLFKQTFIYGIATVLPRMLSFLLVRLYTDLMPTSEYGEVTIVLSWMVFFNVILSYGMETAFFRFYSKEENKKSVIETATISIFWTSISFLSIALLFRNTLADWAGVEIQYVTYAIWILVFDALTIIPFSKLRALQKPMKYAVIKIGNVVLNLGLNIFFLLILPKLAQSNPESFWNTIYMQDFQVGYIFIANLIASLVTLLVFLPDYLFLKWQFSIPLWKNMMHYGWPILFAGLAFGINEHFDKILLEKLLPPNIALSEVGAYSACYKLGLFMVLFRTAYTLGIEPFFFSHAGNENAPQTYATVTKYFVIFGSLILLCVVVFADVLKVILIGNPEYWEAMKVVPLIILANFFLGIYTNLSVWYKLIDKTKIGAYISIFGAIITLLLNFLLIPKFSYMGSAIATLAAYGSMMAISYYLGNKQYPIPYDKKRIFGYLAVSTLLAGLSFYVPMFRESYVFGIAAILLFTYFIYHNEKETLLRIIKRKVV
ncbi:polysaccharide biosynthesis protein [Flavobacterium saliperosum S13]|uniref:Membrane protein involved in the export of O-antigen and teichoic acid n=2 Tax=Flavobacterium saliperosum TaxID=329186 RepID=A0A1G4W3N7_9FLAO|nr:oligosaccharide flippase family protein [Flavobacterium saliperosum]ESU26153.1 polysaccharide biosynthesis protein [Flavobacterium saliperosum S13]SCX16248.1 Membrane protein involved in the export of O-antigen and teichoic acid [Flavobacterium saliperosum]